MKNLHRACYLLAALTFGVSLYLLAQTPQTQVATNGPNAWGIDFCSDHSLQRVVVPISQATGGPTTILSGAAGKRWYVCYLYIHSGASTGNADVGLVEGTGTNCSAVSAGLFGGTTAATQVNLNASGDMINMGNGATTVLTTATAGDNVCFLQSATQQFSGVIVAVNR